jgi:phosphoribosylanthranilate isomerase
MMVKICGITNYDDAMAVVESGAAALGFNFYRDSPRFISPTGAALIAEKLPATVWKVGVFVDATPDTVARIAVQVGLDVAQLHGLSTARGIRTWQACRANESFDLMFAQIQTADDFPEAFLVDAPSKTLHGGTGETFDWSLAKGIEKKVILAGGLDEDNVRRAIEQASPWGVDACSRLEASPGIKDREKLRRFVKAALEN